MQAAYRARAARLAAALASIICTAGTLWACQPTSIQLGADSGPGRWVPTADAGPTPTMYEAIKGEAVQETHGDMHVDRIDYVGKHDNGAGAVGYIFYVHFSDASHLQYERFVRVLRTADGTLHVLTA